MRPIRPVARLVAAAGRLADVAEGTGRAGGRLQLDGVGGVVLVENDEEIEIAVAIVVSSATDPKSQTSAGSNVRTSSATTSGSQSTRWRPSQTALPASTVKVLAIP